MSNDKPIIMMGGGGRMGTREIASNPYEEAVSLARTVKGVSLDPHFIFSPYNKYSNDKNVVNHKQLGIVYSSSIGVPLEDSDIISYKITGRDTDWIANDGNFTKLFYNPEEATEYADILKASWYLWFTDFKDEPIPETCEIIIKTIYGDLTLYMESSSATGSSIMSSLYKNYIYVFGDKVYIDKLETFNSNYTMDMIFPGNITLSKEAIELLDISGEEISIPETNRVWRHSTISGFPLMNLSDIPGYNLFYNDYGCYLMTDVVKYNLNGTISNSTFGIVANKDPEIPETSLNQIYIIEESYFKIKNEAETTGKVFIYLTRDVLVKVPANATKIQFTYYLNDVEYQILTTTIDSEYLIMRCNINELLTLINSGISTNAFAFTVNFPKIINAFDEAVLASVPDLYTDSDNTDFNSIKIKIEYKFME